MHQHVKELITIKKLMHIHKFFEARVPVLN